MISARMMQGAAAAVAFSVAIALAAPAAEASPIWVRDGNGGNVFSGGPGSVNITIKVDGKNQGVSAGAFMLQYTFTDPTPKNSKPVWKDFTTYCLEPDELLDISGTTPKKGKFAGPLSATPLYSGDAVALTRLINTHFADSLTDKTKSAAFQVALWEIAYDSVVDLSAGNFQLLAKDKPKGTAEVNQAAVRTQALAYLNDALWVPFGPPATGVILRVGNQDLIIVDIPEPASLALLGAGLLGLGFAARRRRAA